MSRKVETKEEQKEMEKPFDFDTFELKTIEDYKIWNLHARKAFREAKKHNPRGLRTASVAINFCDYVG